MEEKKITIMVVDDDEQARRLIEAMLAPKGYRIILAKDGQEAEEMARNENPNLILLDIMMPILDGYMTLSRLKAGETTQNIPVIMVSAVGYELNKRFADQLGAAGYITKPVDLTKLNDTVTRVLEPSE